MEDIEMSMLDKIRVRFAPSPTGEPHLGNIRTALYNWLFARNQGGVFIVRIEDTDRDRFVPGSAERILETLEWLGMDFDEGPEVQMANGKWQIVGEKGEYGPYVQSKKVEVYRRKAQELIEKGAAYFCFCTPARLEETRKKALAEKRPPKYDRTCFALSSAATAENLKKGKSHVVRLKVPPGTTEFTDLVFGTITFQNELLDDQVLLKSDGFPTYFLAATIDDHEMAITHIMRADEWIPSTPKIIILYRAFGWEPPKFVHLPIILGSDRGKLSKRHGATAVLEYREEGYLPEAMVNFLALLGWNPSASQEIYSKEELVKEFSIKTLNKAAAIFNKEKLDWLNGLYIRKMPLEELTRQCVPYLEKAGFITSLDQKNTKTPRTKASLVRGKQKQKFTINETGEVVDFEYLMKIVALEQERLVKLSEIPELAGLFLKKVIEYDPALILWKKMSRKEAGERLTVVWDYLKLLPSDSFQKDILERVLKDLIAERNLGVGETLWPFRVALTGRKASPGPFEVAEVLGKEKALERIETAIELLKT